MRWQEPRGRHVYTFFEGGMIMEKLATYRVGRIALHVMAAVGDHEWAFHAAGIRRELVWS